MKNFIFKSTDADLQKIFQSFDKRLNTISSNVLYLTYRIDTMLKTLNKMVIDKGLKQQTLEYFEDKYGENLDSQHPEDEL